MGYTPSTDFLALLRNTGGGVRTEQMPGLDFVVSALARAGLITLVVSATAPVVNQASTAWFQPASPSWTAEGVLNLWNAAAAAFQPATPALWIALLAAGTSAYSFQTTALAAAAIPAGTTLFAVQRAAPVSTILTLPGLAAQFATNRKLQIIDFSTGIAAHDIQLITADGATIMGQVGAAPGWHLLSTAAQLAGVMLQPSPELNSWIIAP